MLLTITYTGENAADLGYLLHKNPGRPQTADVGFGRAHVFYPEVSQTRCSAALLLDMDPLDLARGKPGAAHGGLFDYVNDRPYVSSSFMSTAISRVYGTAMAGRCEKKQALADAELELQAEIVMLPCRGAPSMLERIFAPLGYAVEWESGLLDESFPEWGNGCYVNLRLRGKKRLRDLLRHIYVLIPVFDYRKHYWIDSAEVDKLLAHGEGWLETHPEKVFITRRYFSKLGRFTRLALEQLDRLDNGEGGAENAAAEDEPEAAETAAAAAEKTPRLNERRLAAVAEELEKSGAKSVIDMGCGEGSLLKLLLRNKSFRAVAGMDVSAAALKRAAERLELDRGEEAKKRVTLFQGSLCYRDKRFKNYEAAALVEVIEHIDENRLPALESAVFGEAGFETLVVTTPNFDYNVNYQNLAAGRFRHGDHRFEWNPARFREWADSVSGRYGYSARHEDIGGADGEGRFPTQMAVFTKNAPPEKNAPKDSAANSAPGEAV